MKISGLQKTTLLDYPGKVACTVFTSGCNFRCPFCHNASLALNRGEELPQEELLRFLNKRRGILDGICITGGEPLLNPDINGFVEKVKGLGYSVKLDTNGGFPKRLKELISTGLIDYVAMDIKNSPKRYAETVGVKDFDLTPVSESVEFLKNGAVPYEFRTTVVKELHDENDFVEIGEWISGAEKYFLQCFKESGDLLTEGLSAPTSEEMKKFLEVVKPYVKEVNIRGID